MTDGAVFLATLLILAIGLVLNKRLSVATDELKATMDPALIGQLDPRLQPDALASFVSLWVDRSQAVSLLVPPLLGLDSLRQGSSAWKLSFIALIAAVVCLILVFLPRDASTYGARQGRMAM